MRAFVRNSALAASLLAASPPALATQGVFLPPAPQGSGGEDAIETSDGTRCRQSINSSGTYLDVGATASASKPLDRTAVPTFSDQRDQEGLVYFRLTVPLGSRPARLDCSRLYELEITRLKRELELLKLAAE